jgi:hypothetical protein
MSDRDALLCLFEYTRGEKWLRKLCWLKEERVSRWEGITTDEGGHVLHLNLPENNLSGALPDDKRMRKLVNLESLFLQTNKLHGSIPASLANLQSLQRLKLSWNKLTGYIPPELFTLTKLKLLCLDNNMLKGPIPTEISNLVDLENLNLSRNMLQGVLPQGMSELKRIKFIDLRHNQLGGWENINVESLMRWQGNPRANPDDPSVLFYDGDGVPWYELEERHKKDDFDRAYAKRIMKIQEKHHHDVIQDIRIDKRHTLISGAKTAEAQVSNCWFHNVFPPTPVPDPFLSSLLGGMLPHTSSPSPTPNHNPDLPTGGSRCKSQLSRVVLA